MSRDAEAAPTKFVTCLFSRRSLKEKERLIYSPMSDFGDIMIDKDAVYINLPDNRPINFTRDADAKGQTGLLPADAQPTGAGEAMIFDLQDLQSEGALDKKLDDATLRLFSSSKPIASKDFASKDFDEIEETADDGSKRIRRRVRFDDEGASEDELPSSKKSVKHGSDEDEDEDLFSDDSDSDSNDLIISEGQNGKTPMNGVKRRSQSRIVEVDGDEDEEDLEDLEDDVAESAARYKGRMIENALKSLSARKNWMRIVYGEDAEEDASKSESDSDDEDFFKPVRATKKTSTIDTDDCWRPRAAVSDEGNTVVASILDFNDTELLESLRELFVNDEHGAYDPLSKVTNGEGEAAGSDSEGSEVFGDFEDVENEDNDTKRESGDESGTSSHVFTNFENQFLAESDIESEEEASEDEESEEEDEENYEAARAAAMEKKGAAKKQFDAEYDDKKEAASDSDGDETKEDKGEGQSETTWMDTEKAKMQEQRRRDEEELQGVAPELADALRVSSLKCAYRVVYSC